MLIMRPNVCLLDTPNPINLEDISTSKFYLRSTLLLQCRFETSLIQGIAALLLHLPSDTDFKVGDYLHTNILDTPVYSIYLYLFLSDILSVRRCMFLFKLKYILCSRAIIDVDSRGEVIHICLLFRVRHC